MKNILLTLCLASQLTAALATAASAAAAGPEAAETVTEPVAAIGEVSFLERRLRREEETSGNGFAITPLRPNYVLPVTYNWNVNGAPYPNGGDDLQPVEMKFQISLKVQLWKDLFGKDGDLYAGYTQQSLWQAYNSANSSPFRETNYEPELFMVFDTSVKLLGLRNRLLTVGLVHQSNGRAEPLSRSWNRAYLQFTLDRGPFCLMLKPWYRFPEDAEDDNNPDIDEYLGPGEVRAAYALGSQEFAVLLRSNFEPHDHKGAVQLDWTFPLVGKTKGYVQYFYGYGESMIDYNAVTNRLGVGFLIADWL